MTENSAWNVLPNQVVELNHWDPLKKQTVWRSMHGTVIDCSCLFNNTLEQFHDIET